MKRTLKWLGTLFILFGVMLFGVLMNGNMKSEVREQGLIDAFRSVQATERLDVIPEVAEDDAEIDGLLGVEGILSIPAIDLEAPVLYGTDAATLDTSLGAIENMDRPGEMGGSYAIAGHQAHVFGRFFNRLHEMEVGAEFTFQTNDEEMSFKVFDIQIVKPHEVDVLKPQQDKALISLITCYPAYSNEYRLVVQGERVN